MDRWLSCRSKRRKRKQRAAKIENELDADTLQLLAENSYDGGIRFVIVEMLFQRRVQQITSLLRVNASN